MWEALTLASCQLTGSVFSDQTSPPLWHCFISRPFIQKSWLFYQGCLTTWSTSRSTWWKTWGWKSSTAGDHHNFLTFFVWKSCVLIASLVNLNVYLYLSLSATYSTQIPWERRPHYWADEKGLWSRSSFSSICFSLCKKYSLIVRHQEDKQFWLFHRTQVHLSYPNNWSACPIMTKRADFIPIT